MGCYAQRRIRGGGPPGPGVYLLPNCHVVSVEVDGTSADTLNWTFSQQVSTINNPVPELMADDGFGMASPDTCGGPTIFQISCTYTGKTFTPGMAWQMLTDPSADILCAVPFDFPASGLTV